MTAVAMGYPLGITGEATVTIGIVSAKRYDSDLDREVIQTDTPINPGNSGGPLLSLSGEIVGINTFKMERTGSGRPVEGLGFAVSELTILRLLPGLKAGTLVTAPTPTPVPQPNVAGGVYTSQKYWYSIEVPSGWTLDASDDEAIAIWDPRTGATIWIQIEEIEPEVYPTLDSYISAWDPAAAEDWTDFRLISQHRIRATLPVSAEEYLYSYTNAGAPDRGITDWYVIGKYFIGVDALADEAIWTQDTYSGVKDTLVGVLESFEPSSYTSTENGYSVAHPPDWEVFDNPPTDYTAKESGPETPEVWVYVLSASGYSDVFSYGEASFVSEGNVISRNLVFTGRSNPGYRMDYTATYETTGRPFRGAAHITLSGDNAIWVFSGGVEEDWTSIQYLVDDIFLRVAVVP